MADCKQTYEELVLENEALKQQRINIPSLPLGDRVRRYTLAELGERVLWHGRMPKRESAVLWYTASGIEFSIKAREAWIELDMGGAAEASEYVRITVNGFETVRTAVSPGVTRLCAYSGLPDGEVHTVRLFKEGQPFTYCTHHLTVNAIWTSGEFVNPPKRKWRLEFIGDSITSGEGLGGAPCESAWCPFIFSSRGHYALRVGEALDADISIMAFSGNGMACNYVGDPRSTLPKRYGYVIAAGSAGEGGGEEFDPAQNRTDAVIINLGTNDMGATSKPVFVDPDTGERFVMQNGEDGRLLSESYRCLVDAASGFLADLRAKNPNLRAIVMIYGMMGAREELAEAYREAAAISGGGITTVLRVPTMSSKKPGSVGSRSHPGSVNHAEVAELLSEHLRSLGF